jgi:hypothetical protein
MRKFLLVLVLVLLFAYANAEHDLFEKDEDMESDLTVLNQMMDDVTALSTRRSKRSTKKKRVIKKSSENTKKKKKTIKKKKLIKKKVKKTKKYVTKKERNVFFKLTKFVPITFIVPAGSKRIRCTLKSNVDNKVVPIERWCLVDRKTGEVVVQEEPAPNPQTAQILRDQEKGVVSSGTDFQATFKSSAVTSVVSIMLVVLVAVAAMI